eukprot:scaffold52778_cov33-Phaeocystis_antarctica.AAC.1
MALQMRIHPPGSRARWALGWPPRVLPSECQVVACPTLADSRGQKLGNARSAVEAMRFLSRGM